MENVESYYEEYENPKNKDHNIDVNSRIKWLEDCIKNIENLSKEPGLPSYILESYKKNILDFQKRIDNLKNGLPEFGVKTPSSKEELYHSELYDELYEEPQSELYDELYEETPKKR